MTICLCSWPIIFNNKLFEIECAYHANHADSIQWLLVRIPENLLLRHGGNFFLNSLHFFPSKSTTVHQNLIKQLFIITHKKIMWNPRNWFQLAFIFNLEGRLKLFTKFLQICFSRYAKTPLPGCVFFKLRYQVTVEMA